MRPNNPGSAATQRLRGLVGLASASSQQAEFARAEQFFREALKERPSDAYLLSRLSSSVCSQRRFDEAAEIARHAIESDPSSILAHSALSRALFRADEFEAALSAAREVMRLYAEEPAGYINASLALYELGRPNQLLEVADLGLSVCGTNLVSTAICLQLRALALAQLKRAEEAIEAIDQFLKLRPDDAMTHGNAGWVYWWLGEAFDDRAAGHARAALAKMPAHEESHLVMGLIYQRQRDYLRATHHLQEALRICPNHRRSLDALESVLSAAGSSNAH